MIYELPQGENLEIKTIVLDLNGTLSVHGEVADEVPDLLHKLKELGFRLVLLSGDVRGNAKEFSDEWGLELIIARNADEKEKAILTLHPETCAAIGNARIDIGTFKYAKLSIAALQAEGIHVDILQHVDILIPSLTDALNLFIDEKALVATMRK